MSEDWFAIILLLSTLSVFTEEWRKMKKQMRKGNYVPLHMYCVQEETGKVIITSVCWVSTHRERLLLNMINQFGSESVNKYK